MCLQASAADKWKRGRRGERDRGEWKIPPSSLWNACSEISVIGLDGLQRKIWREYNLFLRSVCFFLLALPNVSWCRPYQHFHPSCSVFLPTFVPPPKTHTHTPTPTPTHTHTHTHTHIHTLALPILLGQTSCTGDPLSNGPEPKVGIVAALGLPQTMNTIWTQREVTDCFIHTHTHRFNEFVIYEISFHVCLLMRRRRMLGG